MAEKETEIYPVLTVPGRGDFVVKLDAGVFFDIELESGLDYSGVIQKLYQAAHDGAPAKVSTVQLFELLARGISNSSGQKITPRELASCYAAGDYVQLTAILVEAIKKSQLSPGTAQAAATQPTEQATLPN